MIIAYRLSVLQISCASSSTCFLLPVQVGIPSVLKVTCLICSSWNTLPSPQNDFLPFPNEAYGDSCSCVRSDTWHRGFCQGAASSGALSKSLAERALGLRGPVLDSEQHHEVFPSGFWNPPPSFPRSPQNSCAENYLCALVGNPMEWLLWLTFPWAFSMNFREIMQDACSLHVSKVTERDYVKCLVRGIFHLQHSASFSCNAWKNWPTWVLI